MQPRYNATTGDLSPTSESSKWKQWASTLAKGTAATTLSTTFAINAFTAPSHAKPSQIHYKWFLKLPAKIKLFSIVNGLSSLGVNAVFNYFSIPQAIKSLIKRLRTYSANPIENSLLLVLSLSSALAAGVIGYEAFIWLNPEAAMASGIASFTVMECTGLFGLINLMEHLKHQTAAQQESIRKLSWIKEDHVATLNNNLQLQTGPLTQAKVDRLLQEMNELIENDLDWIDTKKKQYYYAGKSLDYIIAFASAIAISPVYAQKLMEGVEYLDRAHKISGLTGNLAVGMKDLATIILSLSRPVLYFTQAREFRENFLNLIDYFLQPSDTPKSKTLFIFLLFIGANFCAVTSMYNITENIENDEDNIFNWALPQAASTTYGQILPLLNAAGAFVVNANNAIGKMSKSSSDTNVVDTVAVKDVIKWLKQDTLSSHDNMSAETLEEKIPLLGRRGSP